MIYQIAQELAAAFRTQQVPFAVVFGPEGTQSIGHGKERVVLEQLTDNEKRDSFTFVKATHRNPTMRAIRLQGCRVRIFAKASLAGSQWHEHAERAEHVLDHVVAELDEIVRGRKNTITFGAGGFVTLVDEKGASVWAGAVYELDFTVDRGVMRRKWNGDANREVVIGTDVELSTPQPS